MTVDKGSAVLSPTPVAVLATIGELHREALTYDLRALVQLVTGMRPDLLCLDLTPDQWRRRDAADLPPEYREALLPLADETDIVVVPIAGESLLEDPAAMGWRGIALRPLHAWFARLQCTAPGPAALSRGPRLVVANLLYGLMAALAGNGTRSRWQAYAAELAQRVIDTVRRDPGRRVLVAVGARHCHQVCRALEQYPEVRIVRISEL